MFHEHPNPRDAATTQFDRSAAPDLVLDASALPGLRLRCDLQAGDRIAIGDEIAHDRLQPRLRLVAPATGRITDLRRGLGRRLERVVIEVDRDAPTEVRLRPAEDPREALLANGLWPVFRRRPFGRVPGVEDVPDAIFVDALGGPEAAGAAAMRARPDLLEPGLAALGQLSSGPVFFCRDAGAGNLPIGTARAETGAGATMGHRVARRHSVARQGAVWTVPVQSVLTIGQLVSPGRLDFSRFRAWPGDRAPRRVLPGEWCGREAGRVPWFESPHGADPGRVSPPGRQVPRPIVPVPALDAALPRQLRAVPLLRALSVGDAEAARRLGCLDLLEEDMVEASAICASGSDYGRLLRRVLDRLEAEG
ncbi:hypothetical protein [Limimaricola pyoseonensis]|uniref:Na+-transporting NADH:ubiquinone oxidoreductase subunit A n=1 Tax=Limimaricola pyoseonensis TaxID=521013 RepID=A0A1G7JM62_9RHOB|nr:hypothetical protein [Limimaricola pyoseonensis]SDF26038.1 Na+-transporting NADH:ubiquinone oxidoreductase subunit A [Limimaricola pyoseonensis]